LLTCLQPLSVPARSSGEARFEEFLVLTRPSRQRSSSIGCPRCEAQMDEVVRIEPIQHEPGLIGYECPSCCYVTSVLIPTHSAMP
jgi:transposase-like protein